MSARILSLFPSKFGIAVKATGTPITPAFLICWGKGLRFLQIFIIIFLLYRQMRIFKFGIVAIIEIIPTQKNPQTNPKLTRI